MWRHEAYKMSVQKRALELESVAEINKILDRGRKQRISVAINLSHSIDTECVRVSEKLNLAFRRMSQRIDTLEDSLARSKLSIMRSSASSESYRRSHNTQLSQLCATNKSLQEQIEADKARLSSLEAANAQLRSALATEKKEREDERAELLSRVAREQRYAQDAELARREAGSKQVTTKQVSTPPRATGEVAALIEELHALEAEAQRLVPRNQPR